MRRPYLDWLRGIAVLIMIEGHALDAWTHVADRSQGGYRLAILIAGYGAPVFLFLAGVSLVLAAGSRLRKGGSVEDVARAALRRGAWIVALAFLFRLQSIVISGGSLSSLLKVDILNVMGVSMIIGAALWRLGGNGRGRGIAFTVATIVFAMLTPLVREAGWLSQLPDSLEAYVRPEPGRTTFALFPWAGFLTGGAAVGVVLERARTAKEEQRLALALAVTGAAIAALGYWTSFLPAIYANTSFWTSSPTFFFLRLGVVIAAVPLAYAATRLRPWQPLQEFGRASLFVYWIHVEMAYGVLSLPLHRRLPFSTALAALVLFAALLYALVRLKNRYGGRGRSPEVAPRSGSPIQAA